MSPQALPAPGGFALAIAEVPRQILKDIPMPPRIRPAGTIERESQCPLCPRKRPIAALPRNDAMGQSCSFRAAERPQTFRRVVPPDGSSMPRAGRRCLTSGSFCLRRAWHSPPSQSYRRRRARRRKQRALAPSLACTYAKSHSLWPYLRQRLFDHSDPLILWRRLQKLTQTPCGTEGSNNKKIGLR